VASSFGVSLFYQYYLLLELHHLSLAFLLPQNATVIKPHSVNDCGLLLNGTVFFGLPSAFCQSSYLDKTKPKAGQFLIQIGILVKTSGKTNRVLNFNQNTSVSNRLSSTKKSDL
jgi:hypothetical protein